MRIQGLQKLTLLDYPERMACTVFTAGCNFRCPFCHNASLVTHIPEKADVDEERFFAFLKKRKGILDGVCVTGGEPLLQADIEDFLQKIKELGYLVKLDTNGTNPTKLKELLNNNELRPDFIAMDIKTSPSRYNELSVNHSEQINYEALIKTSIQLIENHQTIQKEYRTVLVPTLITNTDIENISKILPKDASWNFSNFENFNCLNSEYNNIQPYSEQEINNLVSIAKKIIKKTKIR